MAHDPAITSPKEASGATTVRPGESALNAEHARIDVDVLNTGAYTVRVRSQAHFFAVDRALKFDRAVTVGMRLDRPSGSVVRFEPGEIIRVRLLRMSAPPPTWVAPRPTTGPRAGEVRQRNLKS